MCDEPSEADIDALNASLLAADDDYCLQRMSDYWMREEDDAHQAERFELAKEEDECPLDVAYLIWELDMLGLDAEMATARGEHALAAELTAQWRQRDASFNELPY